MRKKPRIPESMLAASRRLRQEATIEEQIVWNQLRNRQLGGLKFRRQAVLERRFIGDFYCHSHRLVIELDGGIHNLPDIHASDEERQLWLEAAGYTVVRFTNRQIHENLDQVLEQMLQLTANLS